MTTGIMRLSTLPSRWKGDAMRSSHRKWFVPAALAVVLAVATLTGIGAGSPAAAVLLSSQASELTEAQGLRTQVLAGFSPGVELVPVEGDPPLIDRLMAEAKAGRGTVDVAGALHGGFVYLQAKDVLSDISDLAGQLQHAGITKNLMDLGRLGTNKQYYIPWMQATYVMVANKQALPYLPPGASVDHLTYAQLLQWSKNLAEKTGQPKLGLPAGANGLLKRFFEGYLLPSYTGGVVTTFKSADAVAAWNYLRELWKYTNPQSLSYDFMSDPLRSGAVWVAWDHVARLQAALTAQPGDFVVFPSPTGPRGQGYMPVIAGLGIPKTAPHPATARALIKYLVGRPAQARILSATGFYPVVGGSLPESLSPGLRLEASAVALQQNARGALPSLLPVGLGTQAGALDKVFTDTFTSVVLQGRDPAQVVAQEAGVLQQIMNQTGAPCWKPDPPSTGACQVK
jgi:multiple sugar transport system substrate-binding protein